MIKKYIVTYCTDTDLFQIEYDHESDAIDFMDGLIWPYYFIVVDEGHYRCEDYSKPGVVFKKNDDHIEMLMRMQEALNLAIKTLGELQNNLAIAKIERILDGKKDERRPDS